MTFAAISGYAQYAMYRKMRLVLYSSGARCCIHRAHSWDDLSVPHMMLPDNISRVWTPAKTRIPIHPMLRWIVIWTSRPNRLKKRACVVYNNNFVVASPIVIPIPHPPKSCNYFPSFSFRRSPNSYSSKFFPLEDGVSRNINGDAGLEVASPTPAASIGLTFSRFESGIFGVLSMVVFS